MKFYIFYPVSYWLAKAFDQELCPLRYVPVQKIVPVYRTFLQRTGFLPVFANRCAALVNALNDLV